MLANGFDIAVEQKGHLRAIEPDFILSGVNRDIQSHLPIGGFEKDDARCAGCFRHAQVSFLRKKWIEDAQQIGENCAKHAVRKSVAIKIAQTSQHSFHKVRN